MKLNPYLNFDGEAERAFQFYQSIFGGNLSLRIMAEGPGMEDLDREERSRVMYVSLPLPGGQVLMGSDILPSQGHVLHRGNNNYISIAPESRADADRIFKGLSRGGVIEMPMQDMFWGDYFGSFQDKFGIYWMINFNGNE